MQIQGRKLLATGLGMALFPLLASADTGVRIQAQTWNPAQPDQQGVQELYRNPALLSDAIAQAWTQARPLICDQFKVRMGAPGAAAGQTLRDIECLLDETPAFSMRRVAPNRFEADVTVGGYVEATSTTPTPLGSYADPRLSIALQGHLLLDLSLQPGSSAFMHVESAKFNLQNANIDSQNFTGDVLKFVADTMIPFFDGPDFRHMAESAIDNVKLDVTRRFNAALASVNTQLPIPAGFALAGSAFQDGMLSIAFMPQVPVPANGRATGIVHWNPTEFTPAHGCDSFRISAQVQAGPKPMYSGQPAPQRQVGQLRIVPAGAGRCSFVLEQLAAGWPNQLTTSISGSAGGSRHAGSLGIGTITALEAEGWNGSVVVPQPSAGNRNYVVVQGISNGRVDLNAKARILRNMGTVAAPVINPADQAVKPGAIKVQAAPSAITNTNLQRLPATGIKSSTISNSKLQQTSVSH